MLQCLHKISMMKNAIAAWAQWEVDGVVVVVVEVLLLIVAGVRKGGETQLIIVTIYANAVVHGVIVPEVVQMSDDKAIT